MTKEPLTATLNLNFRVVTLCLFFYTFTTVCFSETGECPQKPPVFDITYNITPVFGEHPSIFVECELLSDAQGNILLRYENSSWGTDNLFNCISDVKATPAIRQLELCPDESLIKIRGEPERSYRVSYKVKQDFSGPL